MSSLVRRLEHLERGMAPPDPEEDTRAREALAAQFSRIATAFHEEVERCAERGVPVPVRSESPAEQLVRRAMDAAEQDGPWGTPAYNRQFWRVVSRLLAERCRLLYGSAR